MIWSAMPALERVERDVAGLSQAIHGERDDRRGRDQPESRIRCQTKRSCEMWHLCNPNHLVPPAVRQLPFEAAKCTAQLDPAPPFLTPLVLYADTTDTVE